MSLNVNEYVSKCYKNPYYRFRCDLPTFQAAVREANNHRAPLEESVSRIQNLTHLLETAGASAGCVLPKLINTKSPAAIMAALAKKVDKGTFEIDDPVFNKFTPQNTKVAFSIAMKAAIQNRDWNTFDRIVSHQKFVNMANTAIGPVPREPFHQRERMRDYFQKVNLRNHQIKDRKAAFEMFIEAADRCIENGRFDTLGALCEKTNKLALEYFVTKYLGGKKIIESLGTKKFDPLMQIVEKLNPQVKQKHGWEYNTEVLKNLHQEKLNEQRGSVVLQAAHPIQVVSYKSAFDLPDLMVSARSMVVKPISQTMPAFGLRDIFASVRPKAVSASE